MLLSFSQKQSALPPTRRASLRKLSTRLRAFTIIEAVVAMGIVAIAYGMTTQGLLFMNRAAAFSRLRTSARIIVERNILTALSIPYSGAIAPAILAPTAAGGAVYDDDGGGDNLVDLMVQDTGGPVIVRGTLTRIVTLTTTSLDTPNPATDIRKVTFRLNYTYAGRNFSYEITTYRSRS